MEEDTNLGKRRAAALNEKGNASYLERRQEIVNAAARVFLRKGYENSTLKNIADELGIDRASLYYYASSKKYLFDEVLKQASEKNIEYIEDVAKREMTATEKLSLAIAGLMNSYSRDYPYLAIFLQQYLQSSSAEGDATKQASGDWGRRYYNALRSIIQEGKDKGEFEFPLPVGVATNALIGMVNWIQLAKGPNATRSKSSGSKDRVSDTLGAELARFILKSLLK